MQRIHHSLFYAMHKSRSLPLIGLLAIVFFIPITVILVQQSHNLSSHAAVSLPIPTNLASENDDRLARLTWGDAPPAPDPGGVVGYKVVWGPTSNLLQTQH